MWQNLVREILHQRKVDNSKNHDLRSDKETSISLWIVGCVSHELRDKPIRMGNAASSFI